MPATIRHCSQPTAVQVRIEPASATVEATFLAPRARSPPTGRIGPEASTGPPWLPGAPRMYPPASGVGSSLTICSHTASSGQSVAGCARTHAGCRQADPRKTASRCAGRCHTQRRALVVAGRGVMCRGPSAGGRVPQRPGLGSACPRAATPTAAHARGLPGRAPPHLHLAPSPPWRVEGEGG